MFCCLTDRQTDEISYIPDAHWYRESSPKNQLNSFNRGRKNQVLDRHTDVSLELLIKTKV